MLDPFLPLLMTFVAMSAFVVYLITKIPRNYWFKWVAIPVMLLGSFYSYHIYDSMFGYAYPIPTVERSLCLSHRVYEDAKTGEKRIELWTNNLKTDTSRLYVLPWSAQSERALQAAQKRAQKTGVPQVCDFKKKDGVDSKSKGKGKGFGQGGRWFGGWDFDIETYNLPFSEIIRKEDAPSAP